MPLPGTNSGMAPIPDGIVLKRHRDLDRRRREAWVRRALLVLIGLVPLLALFNLFGQRPQLSSAASLPASLSSTRRATSAAACCGRRASLSPPTAS